MKEPQPYLIAACILTATVGLFSTIAFQIHQTHATERACIDAGLGFSWQAAVGSDGKELFCSTVVKAP